MKIILVFTKIGTLSLVFLVCLLCLQSNGDDIGEDCTVDVNCTNSNGACVSSTCGCVTTHYINGTVCTEKSALGEMCINGQSPNQCSVKKSECIPATTGGLEYRCICMASYYRDGQECKSLTDLKVLNLDVPDNTTDETFFVVKWTNPPTVSFINKYQLIIMFNGQNESPADIDKTNTNYNISNRVPGRTYTIILRSVETLTRPTQQTTDVNITDGTRPAIPGAITQSVFNGPTISISWNIIGDLEYLSGIINDTTVSPSTFNKTLQQLPSLSVTNLRHGDKYIFTVTAHSNGFSSAAYTQTIRTTPTRPPPPTEFACDDTNIYDRYMILTWKEPATPNGYIQHYIIYIMFRNMQITTNGSVLEQKVDGLTPEQDYYFNITTVNDATNGESSHSNQIKCPTRAGLSTPPQNVVTTAVTSNKITVHWDYPIDPAGVLWGYRIHLKNETDHTCVQEIIVQCVNGCFGVTNLDYTYNCIKKITLNTNSTQLNQTMSYDIENLLPYVNYKVTIQAVNAAGSGHPEDIIRTTSQETPQKPLNVTGVATSDPKTLQVTWQQPLPRPGITTYTVKVYEENDQKSTFVYKEVFKKEISGYYTQTATIDGLEEYWNYKLIIKAATAIGTVESDMSPAVRTTHSAPGNVVNFMIDHPSEIYNQMNVMWNIPPIRQRNSVIMKYVISHNISGTTESLIVPANAEVSFVKTLNVTAEQSYEVEVYAVNTHNQNGSIINEIYYAEPGPPRTPPVDAVIESTSAPATTQTTIKLKFELSWFLNTDNGMRTDGGVMVCQASKCTGYGSSGQKVGSYFRSLGTWKKSKMDGFNLPYRVTNGSWVDDISELSVTHKQGIITCLPKDNKPRHFLKNWRPISLLNTVYKIGSDVIASRLKRVLEKLIDLDQTCFISGRYIGDNIRLIYDMVQFTEENDIPGATSGRRKRSNKEVELIIGEDVLCDKKDDTVFCNGPLPAGTSFIVVAFACTNGGCTESQHFGPYSTQASPSSIKGNTIENDNTCTAYIVVGVCSSTIAILLLVALVVTCIRYKALQRNVSKANQNVNNTTQEEYNRHYCDLKKNVPSVAGQEYDIIENNYNTIDVDKSQYHNILCMEGEYSSVEPDGHIH